MKTNLPPFSERFLVTIVSVILGAALLLAALAGWAYASSSTAASQAAPGQPTRLYLPWIVQRAASPTVTPIPTAAPGFVPTPYWSGRLNLPAGSQPHGVAVNAAGNRVYVAFHGVNHSGHTLGVVNRLYRE